MLRGSGEPTGGGPPMSRILTLAAAQMGPVQRDHSRDDVVERLIHLLRDAVHASFVELPLLPVI